MEAIEKFTTDEQRKNKQALFLRLLEPNDATLRIQSSHKSY